MALHFLYCMELKLMWSINGEQELETWFRSLRGTSKRDSCQQWAIRREAGWQREDLEKGSENLKRRVRQVVERAYGKFELQRLLERDDIRVDKEAGLHLQEKEVIMEKKGAKNIKCEIIVGKQMNGQESCFYNRDRFELWDSGWHREMGKK